MSEEESVKVAVRVRPFNKRERQRNATVIIGMSGPTTTITNPEVADDVRSFSFDYSYWSHDGSKEEEDGYYAPEGPNSNYIGQKELFNDIGQSILTNAWEGFNTTLFAYGQTGSGKSWSVVGYGANKGIVPMFCDEIFVGIQKKRDEGHVGEYEVLFSMLEIYNERVHDLLNPKSGKSSLKVRNNPKKGFYAEGLLIVPVKNFQDIEMRMEEGTKNRTVASTNMNATSSRAHTIVGITFTQKYKNAAGQETAKRSVVNLVDLAGSERADSTGATGDRLKEGAAINQSLSSLGNVIAALADKSNGKNVRVPYRNSVLTMLLKNALGGNSKTVMIAALSPADINYDETLSTLRYADRAKQIKTKATVNEDPTEKLIRELQEENERLLGMLKKSGAGETVGKIDDDDDDDDDDDTSDLSEEEIKKRIEEELEARMAENARSLEEMKKKWEEKLSEAEQKNKDKDEAKRKATEERSTTPHLYNLNPDPILTGMIVYLLKSGEQKVGKGKQDPKPHIPLTGLNIKSEHAIISNNDGACSITVCPDAIVFVNGEPAIGNIAMHHQDRVKFGSSHLYVFVHPDEKKQMKEQGKALLDVSFEMAQEEIAKNAGYQMKKKQRSNSDFLLQEDLADLLPLVIQTNAMSEELDKKVQFEVAVLGPEARGKSSGKKEVFVKVKQLETGFEWFWSREKFINRKYVMQEMYEDFEEGEDWQVPAERDPFIESPDTECLIGTVEIYMQCVAYKIELREQLTVANYCGIEVGKANIAIVPSDAEGNPIPEDVARVETPAQLEGKRIDFKVEVDSIVGLPKRYTDIYCKYDVFTYDDVRTDVVSDTRNPEYKHSKQITIDKCSKKVLDFLAEKPIIIQLWGKQKLDRKKPINMAAKLGKNTKDIIAQQALTRAGSGIQPQKSIFNSFATKRLAENVLMKKQLERLNNKLNQIKALCDETEQGGQDAVAITDVRLILGISQNTPPNAEPSASPQREATPEAKPSPQREAPPKEVAVVAPFKAVAVVAPVQKYDPDQERSSSSTSSKSSRSDNVEKRNQSCACSIF